MGSVTVGWTQGSPAQINAWVKQASVIYSRLFHWPCVTGARGGGGGDGGGGRGGGGSGDDHCLCSARPPL